MKIYWIPVFTGMTSVGGFVIPAPIFIGTNSSRNPGILFAC